MEIPFEYPGSEYKKIGLFFGNFLYVFRAAMGDFSVYNSSVYLSDAENYLFWLCFIMILLFTNIIFLNFLIAEASNSYSRVKERLFEFNLKESALLIDEAEHMIPGCIRN